MSFRKSNAEQLLVNPFTLINKDWMLVAAGNKQSHNAMTASWGALGEIWNYYTSTIYVRPERYTLEFLDREEYYSLCFFDETHRKTLGFYGSHSGRDCDKDKETGLTPVFDQKAPYYEEAKLVLICRKLYTQSFEEKAFINADLYTKNYSKDGLHRMFIGEICEILVKE
ncbi:flavin reductase [Scatolibacter rhodanostii]|uniref:flavin reductase n=1 Tax=Scatolibacter rhodanostii TaxID=2014781 RepID=UPI000C075927|nr:flavin reductase [Scatolibacter rhodanostii]